MTDRKMTLSVSRDGGRNWSNEKERSLGAVGEYRRRVTFHRLGQSRQLVLRMRVSDPVKATLLGGTAKITPAGS